MPRTLCFLVLLSGACDRLSPDTAGGAQILIVENDGADKALSIPPLRHGARCPFGKATLNVDGRDFCVPMAAAKAFRHDFPDGGTQ